MASWLVDSLTKNLSLGERPVCLPVSAVSAPVDTITASSHRIACSYSAAGLRLRRSGESPGAPPRSGRLGAAFTLRNVSRALSVPGTRSSLRLRVLGRRSPARPTESVDSAGAPREALKPASGGPSPRRHASKDALLLAPPLPWLRRPMP